MYSLRENCTTKLSIPNVELLGKSKGITICFQNCRSLQKHIEDIRKDRYITQADILGIVKQQYLKTNIYMRLTCTTHCLLTKSVLMVWQCIANAM